MSDPVTNVEVEDVLSSIRRLVSDDKRPTSLAETVPSNDRLVLTPALRVAEQDDDLDDTQNENVESVFEGDDFGGDDAETQPEEQAWSDFGARPDDTQSQDEAALPAVQDAPDDLHEGDNGDDITAQDDTEAEADDEAQVEPLILDVAAAVEAETTEPDADVTVEAQDSEIPVAEFISEEQGEAAFFAKSAASLSAKIAALETVIGKTDEQWEPDDTGKSDYSGTEAPAMKWEADAAEDASEEPQVAESDKLEPEAETVLGQAVDDVLDEDALRDLVSDIVREELQGALGERITRNVRKLVRREIHRALAAQDLE
jgi:hypothetical protein